MRNVPDNLFTKGSVNKLAVSNVRETQRLARISENINTQLKDHILEYERNVRKVRNTHEAMRRKLESNTTKVDTDVTALHNEMDEDTFPIAIEPAGSRARACETSEGEGRFTLDHAHERRRARDTSKTENCRYSRTPSGGKTPNQFDDIYQSNDVSKTEMLKRRISKTLLINDCVNTITGKRLSQVFAEDSLTGMGEDPMHVFGRQVSVPESGDVPPVHKSSIVSQSWPGLKDKSHVQSSDAVKKSHSSLYGGARKLRRASSISDPQSMTDEQQKVYGFLQNCPSTDSVNRLHRHRFNRIYTDNTSRQGFHRKNDDSAIPADTPLLLPPMLLPPISTLKHKPLAPRNFGVTRSTPGRYFTDNDWESLRYCRYLRARPNKERDA